MNEAIYLIVSVCCFAAAFGLIWGCGRLMPAPHKPRADNKGNVPGLGNGSVVEPSRIGGAA